MVSTVDTRAIIVSTHKQENQKHSGMGTLAYTDFNGCAPIKCRYI